MAFVEIEVDETEQANFFKFNAIGERFVGVFVSSAMGKAGEYEGRAIASKLEYSFRTKEGVQTIAPPTNLAMKLEKAALKPGHKVLITYEKDIPPTKPGYSAMKFFKVLVDSAPAAAAAPAAPKPAPPPVVDEFADIPF